MLQNANLFEGIQKIRKKYVEQMDEWPGSYQSLTVSQLKELVEGTSAVHRLFWCRFSSVDHDMSTWLVVRVGASLQKVRVSYYQSDTQKKMLEGVPQVFVD